MSELTKTLLFAAVGAVPFAIVTWVVVDTYMWFVRSGGAHVPTGERMPLLIRLTIPYIKGFSRIFAEILRSRGVTSEYQQAAPWETGERKTPDGTRSSVMRWIYDKTRKKLLAAGSPHGFEVEDYWGFALFWWLIFLAIDVMLFVLTGFILGILVAAAAVFFPFAYLSDMIRRRQTRIRKELPFALDLLTLSVEAGMDFTAALANIVTRLRNSALAQEFDQTVKEINIGKQRADSLRDMAGRLGMPEVDTVVSALVQADQLGTGLGEVLRIQAEDVRTRRFQNAEKRAGQVPVKMLFPLVAFIFPVTFLMIAAPLLIQVVRALLRGR